MKEYNIAKEEEIGVGERIVTEIEGKEIAVFNVDGEYVSYLNWCFHQAGPCCEGKVTGTTEATWDSESLTQTLTYTREDEILNCPWHGWEYDIQTGECISRSGVSLPSYPVRIEDGNVIVSL